jgi:phosphatidate cytidylyltransferase
MLKQRIITAAILIPVMVAIIFYLPVRAFCLFTGFVVLMGAWEWTAMMGLKKRVSRLAYLALLSLFFVAMLFISIPLILMVSAGWWVLSLLLVALYPRFSSWWSNSIFWRGLMGLFVLVPCWVAVNYVRNLGNGSYTLLFLFILIWGADITAFFVGKKWGTIKLAPKVSPGKSLQGFLGAVLFSLIAAAVVIYMSGAPQSLWLWLIVLSVATVISSVVGDLFESMLKRNSGLKDSGALLPGHGGLLDRIDSLTAAAPIFALGVFLMMVLAY